MNIKMSICGILDYTICLIASHCKRLFKAFVCDLIKHYISFNGMCCVFGFILFVHVHERTVLC